MDVVYWTRGTPGSMKAWALARVYKDKWLFYSIPSQKVTFLAALAGPSHSIKQEYMKSFERKFQSFSYRGLSKYLLISYNIA